jgi:cation diffusion facilitator CzcD-associated flavoprotein CzcO
MERVDVAVVGAGVAGLGLGARLRQAGLGSFAILERAQRPGGTWRENTYPGVACDVPSHLYSFSFAANPRWSRRYPSQEEILRYLDRVVDENALAGHLRAGTDVRSARFDPQLRAWRLETSRGELEASVLVTACGQLSVPKVPDFAGLEDFRGARFHSARWDHGFDPAGKRVAVIGSGASAIQIVPELARSAARLHVLQRTPPWIIPRRDRGYLRAERALFDRLPALRRAYRSLLYWRMESLFLAFKPGSRFARLLTGMATRHLERQVQDPVLRGALTPDYPIGCKRVLVSDDYYPALGRPGVELVTAAIERFVPEGIRLRDGRVLELDAVVFATGFDAQALVAPMRVEGPDGTTLEQAWAGGPQAHLGMTVAGMPNLFLLYGPNTNLGHNSIIFMLECQFAYVLRCLEELRRSGASTIEVRPEAMARFNARLQQRLSTSVWTAGCSNWYMTGSGRIVNNWWGPSSAYWWATRRPRLRDFAVG